MFRGMYLSIFAPIEGGFCGMEMEDDDGSSTGRQLNIFSTTRYSTVM
jgi:hypothetical protein